MNSFLKLTLAASVAMVLATGCSQSDGDSTSNVTPMSDEPVNGKANGKAIDGYINGATVFADCIDNHKWDPSEPKTTTNADGDYNLSVPDSCQFATLISLGGIDTSTNEAFNGVLMAPAGSKNITPLTTLVVVDPAFAVKIAEYNISIDVDFVDTAIPTDLLVIAQQFAIATSLTNPYSLLKDTSDIIASIVGPLATSLLSVDWQNSNATASALSTASKDALQAIEDEHPDLNVINPAGIKVTVNTALQEIAATIEDHTQEDGNVSLTQALANDISDGVGTASYEMEFHVIVPIVKIISFNINGVEDITSESNFYEATTTETDISTSFTAVVECIDAVDRNYTTSIGMALADVSSLRSAQVVINNIVMSTEIDSPLLTIDPTQTLSMTITGTDTNGELFNAVQMTGGELGAIFTSDGTNLTIDMAALLVKLQDLTAGTDHLLEEFYIPGYYAVAVATDGDLPMDSLNYLLALTINPN